MVKIGFIVEGDTERIILRDKKFTTYLNSIGVQCVPDIINAGGNGNLLPHRIKEDFERLKEQGAEVIVVLTDLDEDACITLTKQRISAPSDGIVVISVKTIEAWFLADEDAMRRYLADPGFTIQNPEEIVKPHEHIHNLRISSSGRGSGDKKILAMLMLRSGFSIPNAAKHTNCPSAKYFLDKIKSLAPQP